MAAKTSAGLLMYRLKKNSLEVFIVHPGGPFFANKDEGAWSIPKGEVNEGEEILAAAEREFKEETGIKPRDPYYPLGTVRLKSGKVIHAWAFEGDWSGLLISNSSKIEWPPKSGKWKSFPEVDKAAFVSVAEAKKKLHPQQALFVERLNDYLLNKIRT